MKNNLIDGGSGFDWGKSSDNYAKYRDIYPKKMYEYLYRLGFGGNAGGILIRKKLFRKYEES